MKRSSEISLLTGVIKGNSKCQHEFFMLHSEMLYATCMRYMQSSEVAEDILQESFMRIFKYINNFDPQKGSLKNWMITICVNECLKALKSRKSIMSLKEVQIENNDISVLDKLAFEDLYEILASLKIPYRTVVNLFLVEGYSHKEISTLLEIKESSSRSILTRAKQMIKNKLETQKIGLYG